MEDLLRYNRKMYVPRVNFVDAGFIVPEQEFNRFTLTSLVEEASDSPLSA